MKFMIEGNEETGSPGNRRICEENKDLLKADFTLISDGEMNLKQPNIEAGFRGGFNSTLTITSGKTDLHSVFMAGLFPARFWKWLNLSPHFMTKTTRLPSRDFYDDVDEIKGKIKKNNEELPFDEPST